MRRQLVLVGLIVFGALSMAAMAQAPKPAASAVKVMKLTDNLFAGDGDARTERAARAAGRMHDSSTLSLSAANSRMT
jgi:hypothetical protein